MQVKFDILLTSYDCVLRDKDLFKNFGDKSKYPKWQIMIVDEAHRLKTMSSQLRGVINDMEYKWLLLLTGN